MTVTVGWGSEWSVAWRRRRLMALNTGVPLLLVAALVWGGAPPHHSAAVLVVLFAVFGVFGSAIPLVRDSEDGLLGRWLLAGVRPRGFLAGRILAQTALDLLQLLPSVLLVVLVSSGAALTSVLPLGATLFLVMLLANIWGVWVAALARSLAEAALFGAVSALLILHAGGVFRTPGAGSWQAAVEVAVPPRLLHEALLGALGAGRAVAGGPTSSTAPALLIAGLFALASIAVTPRLLGALTGVRAR